MTIWSLEEVFPEPRLLPREPGRHAQARATWIDYANTRLVQAFTQLLRAETRDQEAEGRKALGDALAFIEREALARSWAKGPTGSAPRSASSISPSIHGSSGCRPSAASATSPSPRSSRGSGRGIEAVQARPAVRAIQNPVEFYVERFAKFVKPATTTAA